MTTPAKLETEPPAQKTSGKGRKKPSANAQKAAALASLPVEQRGLALFCAELVEADGEDYGRATAYMIPLAAIVERGTNARRAYDKDELEALAKSIRSEGLLNPIIVRPRGPIGTSQYELVTGHRRLRAFRLLGLEKIPAFVRDDLDVADVAVAGAVENLQRSNLSPYEEALAFQAVLEQEGATYDAVAKRVGVSESTIRARLKLLDLPEDLGKRVGEPGFTAEHAQVLLPLAKTAPGLLATAREAVGKPGWDGKTPDPTEFARNVAARLESAKALADPHAHKVLDAVRGNAAAELALKALPRVRIGGAEYVTDVKAFNKVVREAKKAKAEQRAAEKAKAPRETWREQEEIREETRRRVDAAILKASKGVLGLGPRELALLADAAIKSVPRHYARDPSIDPVRDVAEACGIDAGELRPAAELDDGKARAALAAKLATLPDAAPLARLLVVHGLRGLNGYYGGPDWDAYAKAWLGATPAEFTARVKKDRKAAAKAAKKAGTAAAKPGKPKPSPAARKPRPAPGDNGGDGGPPAEEDETLAVAEDVAGDADGDDGGGPCRLIEPDLCSVCAPDTPPLHPEDESPADGEGPGEDDWDDDPFDEEDDVPDADDHDDAAGDAQ